MMTDYELFEKTKKDLESLGFKFKADSLNSNAYKSTNTEIYVWIFEPSYEEVHPYFNAKILAEPQACFDKITRCALVLDYPRSEEQLKWLAAQLDFLKSKQGEDFANEFGKIEVYQENT